MKWNSRDIIEFLNIYEQYPILWNIKDKDYCNTKVKDESFKNLLVKLNEKQLTEGMDMRQLKAKIKSIKDVYRQEINKIEKSRKSGCGTEEVYTPKLVWYNEAKFLAEVVATRRSTSNHELSQSSPDTARDEENENVHSENDNDVFTEEHPKKSPKKMGPPSTPKRSKRPASDLKKRPASEDTEMSQAIKKLDQISKESSDEKPYDQFGKFVASELRLLPQRQAILLQQEIQNSIIRFKLSSLDQQAPHSVESAHSQFSFTSTSASSLNDENGDGDVLHQAIMA